MRQLSIDLETFCETDIKTAGAYKYAEKAEILLFAYRWDGEPVQLVDFTEFWGLGMHPSEYLPQDVWEALPDASVLKTAWNCSFERPVMHHVFGIDLPAEQWKDTMVTAAMCGLPLSLGEAAKALNMEQEKDNTGKTLIRYFSIPCKPTKANGMRSRNLPEHAPDKWEQFKAYCRQDVIVETEIAKRLEWYKIPDTERKLWFLDQKKNGRGIKVDMQLIDQAIKMDKIFRDRLIKEASEITGLGNVNSVAQLRGWLEEETGDAVESLAKNNVTKLIGEVDSAKAKRVLEIRSLIAKSSIKKYLAMKNASGFDDRIRGMIQYYGAQRTGREAGRLAQPQNFPRISDEFEEFLDTARELVKAGDLESIELIFGSEVPNILSQLLRTTFIADEGKEFIVLDFSAIEAVSLSYLADEKWRLDVFDSGGDIYKASASSMFKVPVSEITKDQRQKGKVAELLCIEENQLVLTDCGTIPIKNVTLLHKVWDGEHFVTHEGVIFKGIKTVITYEGLTATPEHIVWSQENEQLQFGQLAARGSHLLQSGNGRKGIRVGKDNKSRKKVGQRLAKAYGVSSVHKLRNYKILRSVVTEPRKIKRVQRLHQVCNAEMVTWSDKRSLPKMRKPERQRVPKLWRSRYSIQLSIRKRSRYLDIRESASTRSQTGIRSNRQQSSLSTRKYKICPAFDKSRKQKINNSFRVDSRRLALCTFSCNSETIGRDVEARNICGGRNSCTTEKKELAFNQREARVYDIVNAGPNNRFTVSNVLVHNCGYGGTKPAMQKMNETITDPKKRIPDKEMTPIIKAWREANSNIVQFWWDTGKAAINTVKTGMKTELVKGISFEMKQGNLMLNMPAGGSICYPGAHLRKYWIATVEKVSKDDEGNYVVEPTKIKLAEVKLGTNDEFRRLMREKGLKQMPDVDPAQRDSLCFWGPNPTTKKWEIMETYGPRVVENICQRFSRDCLMYAVMNMEAASADVNLTVHDELVAEVLKGLMTFEEAKSIMVKRPPWAPGLNLRADGFIGEYYKK